MRKKLWKRAAVAGAVVLTTSLIIPSSVCTYATGFVEFDDETPGIYLEVNYDDDITFNEDDTFIVTYADESGNTGTISVVAADCLSLTSYEMEEGTFTVENLEYKGDNESVLEDGYAVVDDFISKDGGGSILYIAVGEENIHVLESDYGEGGVVRKNSDGEWVNALTTQDDTEESEEIEDETVETEEVSDTSDDEELSSAYTTDTDTDTESDQEPVVEYYDEEDDVSTNHVSTLMKLLRKLGILGIVAIVGIGLIYLFHKRGMY